MPHYDKRKIFGKRVKIIRKDELGPDNYLCAVNTSVLKSLQIGHWRISFTG